MVQPVIQEVTVTKSRIFEAAKVSPHAKQTLETLFPEVFAELKYFDLSKLSSGSNALFTSEQAKAAGFRTNSFIQVRSGFNYDNKGFYLDTHSNIKWELVQDCRNETILLPTRIY